MVRLLPTRFKAASTVAMLMLAALGTTAQLHAAEYPLKPVRLVVPFAAGGGTDLFARTIAALLADVWRQPVTVDNRGGAGGRIGTAAAAKSAPDGYTLLFATPSIITVAPALYQKLAYDSEKDFTPIVEIANIAQVLSTHPSLPVRSVKDFTAFARARPGELNYGSAGTGSASHMAMALLQSAANIKLTHVPYSGTGPATAALLGGHLAVMFQITNATLPLYNAGKINSLAITSLARSESMPKVPTVAESGYPGFETLVWFGLFAPANTPQEFMRQVHQDVVRLLDTPKLRGVLATEGMVGVGRGPEEFRKRVNAEVATWRRVVKDNNISVE